MIIGQYPCCNGELCMQMPERTPVYFREECPHCGAPVWHKLSRVESMSWCEADFLEIYEVDAEAHTITEREPITDAGAPGVGEAEAQIQSLITDLLRAHLDSAPGIMHGSLLQTAKRVE